MRTSAAQLSFLPAAMELRWRLARDRLRTRRHPFYRHMAPLRLPLSLVDSRIAVDTHARFVYYRIPKAANSTVTWSLYRTAGGHETDGIECAKASAFAHPGELSPELAEEAATAFCHFTVVRNPFIRAASAYLDKIAGAEPQARRVARTLGKPAEALQFKDFLDFLEQGSGLRRNAHWAPQVDLIPSPLERLAYIAPTEELDRALPQLLRTLYPDRTPRVERYEHKQTGSGRDTRTTSRAVERLAELYDGEALERVARLYRRDFEAFGYDPQRLPET